MRSIASSPNQAARRRVGIGDDDAAVVAQVVLGPDLEVLAQGTFS